MPEDEQYQPLQMKKYIIAYIDILGTKGRIADNDSLQKINEIYQFTLKQLKMLEELTGEQSEFSIKIFSDNILAAIEISDDDNIARKQVDEMIHFAASFQIAAHVIATWSIRGGITIGDLYISDSDVFVWGPGLMRAYKLESEYAKYPRVIMDPESSELITKADLVSSVIATDGISESFPIPIIIDEDKYRFISYEEYPDKENNPIFIEKVFESLLIQILNYLCSPDKDTSIEDKLEWSIKYHNKICNSHMKNKECISLDYLKGSNWIYKVQNELRHRVKIADEDFDD